MGQDGDVPAKKSSIPPRHSRALGKLCPAMAVLVARHGPVKFAWGAKIDYFAALARSITFQQLAGKAAAAIWGRFLALFDGSPTPEAVLRKRDSTLRACGLSGSKIASIKDLARKVKDGTIDLERFPALEDEAIVEQLVQVRGIGVWTAQMFLIFQLDRLDVWPVLDYGVRKGFSRIYGHEPMLTAKQLEPHGERFRPYRSLAAWYCWRVLDPATQEAAEKEES
jgi:DNA-3-methyladenine glycosylase II